MIQEKGIFLICAYAVIIGLSFILVGIFGIGNSTNISESPSITQEKRGIFTAYNAEIYQTDSDPTITASNQMVRVGIVANNCLPFGTKIKVNDEVYEVQDRMNKRYGCNYFDIYMCDYYDAIKFGKRILTYEII